MFFSCISSMMSLCRLASYPAQYISIKGKKSQTFNKLCRVFGKTVVIPLYWTTCSTIFINAKILPTSDICTRTLGKSSLPAVKRSNDKQQISNHLICREWLQWCRCTRHLRFFARILSSTIDNSSYSSSSVSQQSHFSSSFYLKINC